MGSILQEKLDNLRFMWHYNTVNMIQFNAWIQIYANFIPFAYFFRTFRARAITKP